MYLPTCALGLAASCAQQHDDLRRHHVADFHEGRFTGR
jgi:hypothetical protein